MEYYYLVVVSSVFEVFLKTLFEGFDIRETSRFKLRQDSMSSLFVCACVCTCAHAWIQKERDDRK